MLLSILSFWDIVPCNQVIRTQCFEAVWCPHLTFNSWTDQEGILSRTYQPSKIRTPLPWNVYVQLPSDAVFYPWNTESSTTPLQESQNLNTWLLFSVLRADKLTTVCCRVPEQDVRSVALPVLAIVIRRMGWEQVFPSAQVESGQPHSSCLVSAAARARRCFSISWVTMASTVSAVCKSYQIHNS
jgi:hypothetical protein